MLTWTPSKQIGMWDDGYVQPALNQAVRILSTYVAQLFLFVLRIRSID
jgi:hypothetical protein